MTPGPTDPLSLRVAAIRDVADGIRALVLVAAGGGSLPVYEAGAHLRFPIALPDGTSCVREYSIAGDPRERERYEIAVLHDRGGRGGSARMHALRVDDVVVASGPLNAFPIAAEADDHLLVAGGIGITPLLCMARTLKARDATMAIHYVARSPARMAYREEAEALGARLYFDEGDASRGLPLSTVLASPGPNRHLYVCGPAPMIAAAIETATALGWSRSQIHHESFGGAVALASDRPVRVHLKASRRTVDVAADESILDALLREGLDPLHDCRRGECGLCMTDVLDGVPDHRDHVLSARERDGGRVICTCVSRALTPELTLDL